MQTLLSTIGAFLGGLPPGVRALLILLGGCLAAMLLRFLLRKLLELIRFNAFCDKTGVSEFLRKGQVRHPPSRLVGSVAYWSTLLAALFQISRVMDIKVVTSFMDRLTSVVPGLLAGAFIGIIGLVIVSFIGNFVMTLARNAGFPYAALLARVVKVCGYILVTGLALAQVDQDRMLVNSMLQIMFAAVVFGLALAFGIGCKDMARDAAIHWLQNLKEKSRADSRADLEG
jgi:hypothetical protein